MAAKKKLGKGLSALIGDNSLAAAPEETRQGIQKRIFDIKVHEITAHPDQPRSTFDTASLQELAASLKSVGMIEPIIVTPGGEKQYQLIAGERRWRAAQLAGFKTIPALIKEPKDIGDQILEIMLIENIQREDLTPIEEARSYELLIDKHHLTHDKLARLIGKSRAHISNLLRILKLPAAVQEQINKKQLSLGHAKAIMALPEKQQSGIVKKILENGMSVREVEALAQHNNQSVPRGTKNSSKKASKKNVHLAQIESALRDFFKTKVRLQEKPGGGGNIAIEYYSADDLQHILSSLRIKL